MLVDYHKGHSNRQSIQSRLNADANHFATAAQRCLKEIPVAPTPTFTMNDFTFYRWKDGWLESNIHVFVDQVLTKLMAAYLAEGHRNQMTTWLYHTPDPPSYIYHKATSAYTATAQLYARSGQLATAERVEERQGDGNGGYCRLGCLEMEDERHIFSNCPYFDEWRWEAGRQLRRTLSTRLGQLKLHGRTVDMILRKAELFYTCDSDIWPLGNSQYYLGLVPKMQDWLREEGLGSLERERLIHGIYCEWYSTGVRLASRIFGELQRKVTRV